MNSSIFVFASTIFCLCSATLSAAEPASEVVFSRDVQPLFAKHCLVCHGPDDAEAGLRLDLAENAYAERDSGATAIVPAHPDASELLRRVRSTDESDRMPPEGDPLTPEQISTLERWINDGAKYERHWAYRPVQEPTPPEVHNKNWVRHPIDRFVLSRLENAGIEPSPEAPPATLIKRLYYDLTGLPPTPDEVDAFLNDTSANAYETVVDRLLASEHFGERWGRHWLDAARYADSDGYEKDRPRPHAWRYRDWVIDAINSDMPYDQFTVEQLAGDLLPDPTPMQKLATAFHRQTLTNTEGGTDQEEFRVEATFDRTETTGAVWMGLTLTCARCHTHKYDRIAQSEYYGLFAFFNNANEANTPIAKSDEALALYEKQKSVHDAKVAELTTEYEAAKQKLRPEFEAWEQKLTAKVAAATSPVELHGVTVLEVTAESGATMTVADDGSVLVSGATSDATVPDKDRYELVVEVPEAPFSGIQLEVLTDPSLPANGPGRAPNGNFVLSEVHAEFLPEEGAGDAMLIAFTDAEADVAQDKFPPTGVLSTEPKSGWAIAPKQGADHRLTLYTNAPVHPPASRKLRIVLQQQYGGRHTLGRFRVQVRTGFDPLRGLPKAVAEAIGTAPEQRTDEHRNAIIEHVASLFPETADLARQLADLEKKAPASPMLPIRVIVPATRTTHVLHRGDFLQPSDVVSASALNVVAEVHPLVSRRPDAPADRLDLAKWLVDESHPLTPRVSVNQVWAHLFGEGLVRTLNDFGVRGEQPTHPELLDWLAWNFPRSMGWSRKALIKSIVMSATYRQSSRHRPELRNIDPTNRLLARQNRSRVEAEIVRDLSLAASGLLSPKIGGPSVFPPLPSGVAELSYANNFKWNTSAGEDRYRRGMYTFFKRTSPHPTLISFDCPDSNTTKLDRDASNTPLQALATLNNEVFTEAAQAMAGRVLSEGGSDDAARLTFALRLCVARPPDSSEVARFHDLLSAAREYYESHPEDAALLTKSHAVEGVSTAENAAWVATLRMVMNLDEFIVRD